MGYVCIHGHFYQPPRENPWLEAIERQDSAHPYHDWNERITAECYSVNAASRILDNQGYIVKIVNNYAKISFDFGPTLLSWLQEHAPDTHQAIQEADQKSRKLFSGHGSAIAQAYNHMILPLASRRDKLTQVVWGISDFRHRFKRKPEGMWLPETAVDLESLEILAECGIHFTILSPYQAKRVRKMGGRTWRELNPGEIDPSMAYRLRLPSRRLINLFFYDGPISRAVAFEGLLGNGEHFAQRLMGGFAEAARPWPEMVHIATDGESYGHHHRHGDMGLAYALEYIEANHLAQITNYGEYLERHPPTHEVEIVENTSWSCAHGIERWRSDCGCQSGAHPGWNQAWRGPLREALDWLRDSLAGPYQTLAAQFLKDPWAARNDYVQIVLDRNPQVFEKFLEKHAKQPLEAAQKVTLLKVMELQRHAMLMYTSCGWFFDELSGIETVQVIQYAGRALHLAYELIGPSVQTIEAEFLQRLSQAKSNIPEHRDGKQIYERLVRPAIVDLPKVGAHYAISSLFEPYEREARIYCYSVDRGDYKYVESGRTKLVLGHALFTSQITRELCSLSFGVLHFGDHNLSGGVRPFHGEDEAYQQLLKDVTQAFLRADFPQVIRILDQGFGTNIYSLALLFRDEQRKILNLVLESRLSEAGAAYAKIYDDLASLMRYLKALGIPLPKSFRTAAEYAVNQRLREAFETNEINLDRIGSLLEEAKLAEVTLDAESLEFTLRKNAEYCVRQLLGNPTDLLALQRLQAVVGLARSLTFEVHLRTVENLFYEVLQKTYPSLRQRAQEGDPEAKLWVNDFKSSAEKVKLRVVDGTVGVPK